MWGMQLHPAASLGRQPRGHPTTKANVTSCSQKPHCTPLPAPHPDTNTILAEEMPAEDELLINTLGKMLC